MTIQRRLVLLLAPAFALLMLLAALIDYRIAVVATRTTYDQALDGAARATAALLSTEGGMLRFLPPTQLRPGATGAGENSLIYVITGPDGKLIAGSTLLPEAMSSGNPAFADINYAGRSLRVATLRVMTPAGAAHVTVAEPTALRSQALHTMLIGDLLVDFVELNAVLLLLSIGIYFSLRPVRALGAQVEGRSPREFQPFAEADLPGEVRPLILAVNRLLDLLNDASHAQQRFIADAAHQLRTPLAGLLAQLELLLAKPAAAALKSELISVHRAIQHVAHSANQLLSLARAEPLATLPGHFVPNALEERVAQVVERNLDRADLAGIDLGAEAVPAAVLGDAWLLDDLLNNLVDNALIYTPRGGRVTVRCGVQAEGPFLEVEDNGPGIPLAERQRVRERFYRSAGSPGSGSGLGLAIVDEIARVHGAQLAILSGSGARGSRMRIQFAAQAAASS
ncbi:MAG: sensor histidine kinase N-terminal domain-containing protein [Steroidobacteraceae bacterium]